MIASITTGLGAFAMLCLILAIIVLAMLTILLPVYVFMAANDIRRMRKVIDQLVITHHDRTH